LAGYNGNEGDADIYVLSAVYGSIANGTLANAYQPVFGGGTSDAFLAKYNTSGQKQWSTYYGGPGDEYGLLPFPFNYVYLPGGNGLSVAPDGNLFMIATTTSTQGIEKGCSPYPAVHKISFISQWQPSGNLLWSSYYDAELSTVCAGTGNNFYVGGTTVYDSLATPAALQTTMVPDKLTGLIARFTSTPTCPQRTFHVITNNNQLSVDSGYASYQWYGNGNLIAGANNNTYAVNTDTGLYYAVIADSCGCVYTSDTVHFPPTGITQTKAAGMDVMVYPNPGKGLYTVSGKVSNGINAIAYHITDVSGRVITQESLPVRGGIFNSALNLTSLANGLYFLHLESGNGSTVIKLVKGE
jgi:hypothetical protein